MMIRITPASRALVALAALLALAACATQPATSAPATAVASPAPTAATAPSAATATPPASPAQARAAATACDLVTATNVSLVIPNPPVPTAQSVTVKGVPVSACSYLDPATGARFRLTLSTDPQAVAQITALLPTLKAQPGLTQSSASGADIYVSGGPNQSGSDKGDAFVAYVVKANSAVSILAGAQTYHYDSAKAVAVLQDIASRLP